MLTDERRAPPVGAGRLRQVDRGRRQRQGAGNARELALGEEPGIADMRLVEGLLWRVDLAGDDAGLFERGERFLAASLAAPLAHSGGDRGAIVSARLIVLEPRVGNPAWLADHL